jgi:DNA polymerase-3 subunit alpha
MAAKSAIKDVARISRVSIDESNRLTKMVPDRLSEKKQKEYPFNPKLDELKPGFKKVEREEDGVMKTFQVGMEDVDVKITLKNCYRLVPEFIEELKNGPEINKEVLKYAEALEGCVRQVGVHACATIIGRGDLTDYLPICLSKDKETGEDVRTSQYDGHYIEDVGMLKMDFLGLITLSIIHNCLNLIKEHHGEDIDIEAIPIDDGPTYDLYGRGDTTSVFQFESEGMKTWLQKLRPTRFEDLIAMNALYRPGPMDYIPDFVARKQGEQAIEYDLPEMEEYLEDTYGVTVYQEQVMLLSQKLAGFTKGEADKLRKAMGKKQIDILNSLKDKFMSGGIANGHPEKVLDKIWKDWEKFAQYAFNKSHATCYAWVSYQTGWLKCHYPSEFFASCLDCAKSMEEIVKIMDDCKGHGIKVLSPDVNESADHFTVNKSGDVRFALGSIKGFGANVVDAIIKEREENGLFTDIFDFVERMSGAVNRKSFEGLLNAGAFDSFGHKRSMYYQIAKGAADPFIDQITRYGDLYKNDTLTGAASLFGDMEEMKPERPALPEDEGYLDVMEMLQREKDLVGMYLSSHPLDRYDFEMRHFVNCKLAELSNYISECESKKQTPKVYIAGIVTDFKQLTTKTGKPYSRTVLEDYSGSYELALFGKDHEAFMQYMQPKATLFLEGEIGEKFALRAEERAQGKTAPYAFKIRKISLLGNITDDLLSGFSMDVTTPMLTQKFREDLVKVVKKHKGNIPLTLFLYDPGTKYRIQFYSKKFRVAVTSEFIQDLHKIGVDKYEVTRK